MNKRIYKIDGAMIRVSDLAQTVWLCGQYLKDHFSSNDLTEPGEDFCGTDFRLQVRDGSWVTHEGDSQYDQDHRGFWGYASVPRAVSKKEAREIAIQLLEESSDMEESS